VLALPEVVIGRRDNVAVGELLSFDDGPSGPVNGVGAVRDLINVGVTPMVDETSCQMHAIT